jgi:hypothetical protein
MLPQVRLCTGRNSGWFRQVAGQEKDTLGSLTSTDPAAPRLESALVVHRAEPGPGSVSVGAWLSFGWDRVSFGRCTAELRSVHSEVVHRAVHRHHSAPRRTACVPTATARSGVR